MIEHPVRERRSWHRHEGGSSPDDESALRRAFAQYPSGVTALAAVVDDVPVVLIASSFQVGISLAPPLALVAVGHSSTSWPKLKLAPSIGVSILAASHGNAARRLSSPATVDRFAGIKTSTTSTGAHYVVGAPAHLECHIHSEIEAGDHDVVLLRIDATMHHGDRDPLIWHRSRFRALSPELH